MIKVYLKNDGTINKNRVTLETERGNLVLYFSYETIIGFVYAGERVVCKNEWSKTTGKYLNEIEPNKENRVDSVVMLEKLEKILNNF